MGLQGHCNDEARGFFSCRESKMSSNGRKLTVVLFLIMTAARHLTNFMVLTKIDTIMTKAYINHMGGQIRYLSPMAHRLWQVAY